MRTMVLKRVASNFDGTFGVLIDGAGVVPFALTLEDQWKNNQKNISCIPHGYYTCRRVISPRFGETFEVLEVPGRTHILFHSGNTHEHTQGCILVGEEFGYLGPTISILSSRRGFAEFMHRLEGIEEFSLAVLWT